MTRDLSRLIRPQSIAVFGGKEARRVIEQCDKMGFTGEIWPVHPKQDEILGRKCYRSVADLPGAPDASFVGVNRTLTIEIIRELSARGAGGAICYASGFREAVSELADGSDLQEALVEGRRRHARSSDRIATASSTCWMAPCSGRTSTACSASNAASPS